MKPTKKQKDKAYTEGGALVEMYQAGFLDGYLCMTKKTKDEIRVWARIHTKAANSFEKRFVNTLKTKLKGGKKKYGRKK